MEMERPREGGSGSSSRSRERHMVDSPAGSYHSMSTQISRQTTNEDFLVKRVGLGKITTKDASSQLPEVSKGSNGWNVGKNTGQKRNRPALNEKAFVKVKPKQPGKVKPKQPGKDDLLKLGVCFVFGCKDIADKTVLDKVMLRRMSTCGGKERREYTLCEDHFIQLMFEEMEQKVDKENT